MVDAVSKASGAELLRSIYQEAHRHLPPEGREEVRQAICSQTLTLLAKAEKADLSTWHRLIEDVNSPVALKRAYAARYAVVMATGVFAR